MAKENKTLAPVIINWFTNLAGPIEALIEIGAIKIKGHLYYIYIFPLI